MKPVYYDEKTGTGWKLNPKDDEYRGWTYYKDYKARDKEGVRHSDESKFSTNWIRKNLLIRPTKLAIGATPGVKEFFQRNSLKLKPYRKNPIGMIHTGGEMVVGGLVNKAKEVYEKNTWEPGTSQGKTVFDVKEELKINKQNKVNQLIQEAQNRKNQKVEK